MKTKLKRCLVVLIILVTYFCIVDHSFIGNKIFAGFVVPKVYADSPYEDDEEQTTISDDEFKAEIVRIAREIAADTYVPRFSNPNNQISKPYTYQWGGDGYRNQGKSGTYYTVYDCRGLVSASIRYAAKENNLSDNLKNLYIGSTSTQYHDIQNLFGCHKLTSESELEPGDILWRKSHTEIFFRKGSEAMQVGACQTSKEFHKAAKYGGDYGTCEPTESIKEYKFQGVEKWEAYFRYGTTSDYEPRGYIDAAGADDEEGYLGSGNYYIGPVDKEAKLDEQVFEFQGNPQSVIYDEAESIGLWLFKLLSQFLDYITGLLVSLLVNPIMQALNAIVNFLTNFINRISGLETGT